MEVGGSNPATLLGLRKLPIVPIPDVSPLQIAIHYLK